MKLSILACLVVGSSAFVGPQKSTVSTLERKKEECILRFPSFNFNIKNPFSSAISIEPIG